jgi:hypothetical protein
MLNCKSSKFKKKKKKPQRAERERRLSCDLWQVIADVVVVAVAVGVGRHIVEAKATADAVAK